MGSRFSDLRPQRSECVLSFNWKTKETVLFKVTESSSVPYRAPSACAKMAAYPDPVTVSEGISFFEALVPSTVSFVPLGRERARARERERERELRLAVG